MTTNAGDPPIRMVRAALRRTLKAVEFLAGGLGTAILAMLMLVWFAAVGLLSVLGVGLLLLPSALTTLRTVADRERERLNRWGHQVIAPQQPNQAQLGGRLRDPVTRRDLRWLVCHSSLGLLLGLLGVLLPVLAVRDLSFPLWWQLLPEGEVSASLGFPVRGWPSIIAVALMGLGWAAIIVGLGPGMARLQALPGVRLLGPPPGVDLSGRVAELTATRAAALQAHAAELRRIERSLHDGAQNRMVGAVVLLGAARQALARDPALADAALGRAQSAAEDALKELRSVVRSILPPVLDDRGLEGALTALAAGCAVPCRLEVEVPGRCATSVEATAYFVVAETLTNVSKHSGASEVQLLVRRTGDRLRIRVHDNGHGGADAAGHDGSGICGIRRRVQAHDGTFDLHSPPGGPTTIEVELPCGS